MQKRGKSTKARSLKWFGAMLGGYLYKKHPFTTHGPCMVLNLVAAVDSVSLITQSSKERELGKEMLD